MTTMKYADVDFGTSEAVFNIIGGMEGIAALLRGDLVVRPRRYIVRVDRAITPPPPYGSESIELLHPELQTAGPKSYDLSRISQWIHPSQAAWPPDFLGEQLYEHLRDNTMLERCLGYTDGLRIEKMGAQIFRKFFGRNTAYLWRSAAVDRTRGAELLIVPTLSVHSDHPNEVWFGWGGVGILGADRKHRPGGGLKRDQVALMLPLRASRRKTN